MEVGLTSHSGKRLEFRQPLATPGCDPRARVSIRRRGRKARLTAKVSDAREDPPITSAALVLPKGLRRGKARPGVGGERIEHPTEGLAPPADPALSGRRRARRDLGVARPEGDPPPEAPRPCASATDGRPREDDHAAAPGASPGQGAAGAARGLTGRAIRPPSCPSWCPRVAVGTEHAQALEPSLLAPGLCR